MKGPNERRNVYRLHRDVAERLEAALDSVTSSQSASSGMTEEEEAVVEQHLRELGYL